MILLTALIGVCGGQAIGAVFGAFTIPMWIELATTLIQLTPDVVAILEKIIPAFAGVGKLIAGGVQKDALGPLLSENFKKWLATNGDMTIKLYPETAVA